MIIVVHNECHFYSNVLDYLNNFIIITISQDNYFRPPPPLIEKCFLDATSYSLAAATRQPCGVAGNVPQGSACPQGTRGERRGKALDRLFEGAEHLVEDRFCLSTYPSR